MHIYKHGTFTSLSALSGWLIVESADSVSGYCAEGMFREARSEGEYRENPPYGPSRMPGWACVARVYKMGQRVS